MTASSVSKGMMGTLRCGAVRCAAATRKAESRNIAYNDDTRRVLSSSASRSKRKRHATILVWSVSTTVYETASFSIELNILRVASEFTDASSSLIESAYIIPER